MILKSPAPINEPMQYDQDKKRLSPLWVLWFQEVAKKINGLFDYLIFNTNSPVVPTDTGTLSWDVTDGTLNVALYNGSVLQVGQELHFYGKASGNIANGELCQFAGVQGDHILMKKAVAAEVIANPHYLIGIATQNITNGTFGYVTWFGKVNGVYTNTPANNDSANWLAGDILYFDNTTGQLTKTAPSAPEIRIIIAAVIKVQTGSSETGILLVRPSFGTNLVDLDDVDGVVPSVTGQALYYDSATQVWNPTSNILIDDAALAIRSTGTAANDLNIACGTDKTIVLTETVWQDIDFPIIARTASAGNPTPATLIGNLSAPRWAVNDWIMCEGQEIVHLWKEGSDWHWHLHLITNGTETVAKYVKFQVEFSYATLGGVLQGPFTVTSAADLTIPANTADRTHLIFPINTYTPVSGIKIGTQVYARLTRIAASGTAPANDPFVPMLQIHIECDTMGSRQIGVK